ncbi:MAG: DNA repair protein RadC [Myxococcales bacterium]|jgi:DNA repair protein RadC|nr:DNA repair protein RadC [Myxococcales bacterium]
MRNLELWEMDAQREKLLLHGESALANEELLAMLLEGRSDGMTALERAAELIDHYGDLATLRRASLADLASRKGMSLSLACTLVAAVEFGARAQMPRRQRFLVTGVQSVFEFYAPRLSHLSHERFHVMCLDARHLLLRDALVAIGGAATCGIEPREALVEAIRLQSHAVIFVHNHPSGDPAPSNDDLSVTRRLKRACELLGVVPLDHVIIGEGRFVSLVNAGLFSEL